MSKIILVRGSVPDTSAALDSRIYFDQNGVLSKRFGLTSVPARITPAPSGERLNIETFLLNKDVSVKSLTLFLSALMMWGYSLSAAAGPLLRGTFC